MRTIEACGPDGKICTWPAPGAGRSGGEGGAKGVPVCSEVSVSETASSTQAAGPSIRTMASTHSPTPASCLKKRGSAMFMLPV